MKNFLRAFFVSVCMLLLCQETKAQGTIPKGAIAFTGFSMGTNCSFAFIIIKSLPAGETLYFTDQGWAGAGWTTTPETHMKWVIPAGMTAGKVIVVKVAGGVFGVTNTTGLNIEPGYGMMQLLDGDQIIAYQSTSGPEPASPEFIAAAHFDNNYLNNNATTHWNNTATGPDESVLPTGLTPGENSAAPFSTFAAQAQVYTFELPINGGSGEYVRYFINTHTWANAATAYPLTYLNWYPNRLGWPVVSVDVPGNVGTKTATVGGNVISEGETPVTERGFVWAIGGVMPTISDNKMPNGTGGGSFSKVETGFPVSTYVTYRTYATNAYGTSYSTVSGFNTNAALSATIINKLDIACNAGSTGEATAAGSGGLPPYAYQWNTGATTAKIAGVIAGRYSVVVTDAEGSSFMVPEFILWQNSAIRTTPSRANVTCNGARNGVAGVQVSGGIRPYSYAWAPYGGNTAIAAGLSGGTFTCTITDINGCTFVSAPIVITEPTALTASATKTDILCKNLATGSAKATASGGTAPYTYSWAPSGGNAAIATGLPAGSYTCTITDKNLCQITTTVMIAEPAAEMAGIASQMNVLCAGNANGSATVNVTGGTGSYTYLWSDGQTAATAIGLLPGTYTCTIKDNNNCQLSPTFMITEPAALTASIAVTNVSCFNGSDGKADMTVNGGTAPYTYAWTSSGSTSATATGFTAGVYSCTITDANGCTLILPFTITEPSALSVNTSHTNVHCNGESNGTAAVIVTGGTPSYTYAWTSSGGNAATASGLIAGNYSCTITDAKGCSIHAPVTITAPAMLTASNIYTNVSCNGANDGTATVSVSGGTPGYTYNWAPSGGNAATATGLLPGLYTCTITDANGCTVISSVTITEPTAITATVSQTNVTCKGANDAIAAVSVTGGSGAYTYVWMPSGGTNATATGLAPGNFTCTITDAGGCSSTANFTITEPPLITVTATSQHNITCYGTATGSASVNATGGTPGYSYLWAPSGGTAATASNLAAGIYICTVTDANGCTGTLSFTLTAPTALAATISKTDVTTAGGNDGTASVIVTGGTGAYNYTWSPSGSNTSVAANLHAGNYTCVIKDVNNCEIISSITLLEPAALSNFPALFRKYGDAANTLTAPASNGTGTFSYTSSNTSVAMITGNTLTILTPGTTTITATQAPDANYNMASVASLLTVAPKDISVTLTDLPAISKQYDGNITATLEAGNYQLQGVLGNDDVTVNAALVQYDNKNAGTGKTVTASNFVLSGAQYSYYNLVTVTAGTTGSITAKPITVTAMPVTKVYDGTTSANVAFNPVTITDGLMGTDNLSLQYTAAFFDNKNTGTGKPLSFTGLIFAGTDKDNYSLQPVTATGSITVKPITVTATAQAKVYGAADPVFAYTITNGGPLATGDSFAGSLMRGSGENVGTYPVNVGTLSVESNYAMTYAGTVFAIQPKGLVITAENREIFTGDALPVLTPRYDGLVNGESAAVLTTLPVLTTNATAASPVGIYPILVSGAAATNYNISYENGTLNIRASIPTAINFTATALFENNPAGSIAGALSAVSTNPAETFTYTLVPGSGAVDNALFTISGSNIVTTAPLNYEQETTYAVRVRTTTGNNTWLEKELRIAVNDINEQPALDIITDQAICFNTATQTLAITGITPGPELQQVITLRVSADKDVFHLLEIVSTGAGTANVRYTLKQGVTGDVIIKIVVTDNGGIANGGIDQAEWSFKLTVNNLPVFSIQSSKPSLVSRGDAVTLSATGNTMQYLWSEAPGIPAGTQGAEVTVRPLQTTTYTVTGTLGDCRGEQSYTVQVVEDFKLDATNVVTPNGDGINDKWIIRNIESYPLNVVKIFDRSGRLMYTKSGYLNEWDGTVNGKPLAEGTYYYAIDLGNGKKVFKGFITIIR